MILPTSVNSLKYAYDLTSFEPLLTESLTIQSLSRGYDIRVRKKCLHVTS